jgi:hypothetical protein
MKESGIGRENGVEAFEACKSIPEQCHGSCLVYGVGPDSQSKSTIVNIASANETREHDDWFGDEAENKRYG